MMQTRASDKTMIDDDGTASSRLPLAVVRLLAGLGVFSLVLVPWLLGAHAVNDAVLWMAEVYAPHEMPLVSRAWELKFFRPIELLAAAMTDPVTRDSRFALLLHLPAIGALVLGLRELCQRLVPDTKYVFPLATLLFALHSATSLVVWQMDTVSQTWAGASGLWFMLLLWRGLDQAAKGAPLTGLSVALLGTAVVGLLSKETFLGWWLLACLVLLLLGLGRGPGLLGRGGGSFWSRLPVPLVLAVVPLSLVFLFARLGSSELMPLVLESFGADAEPAGVANRYRMELGLNFVANVGLALVGTLPGGSTHTLFGLEGASQFARLSSPVLLLCCGLLGLWPLVAARSNRDELARLRARYVPLVLSVLASLVSLAAVLPIQQISEIYLVGPNVVSSILLATLVVDGLGLVRWRHAHRALLCVVLVLMTVAMVSRARHMAIGWGYSAALNDAVRLHQLEAMEDGDRALVGIPASCTVGGNYSNVVLTPLAALFVEETLEWLNADRPLRPLVLGDRGGAFDLVLPCDELPTRPSW